MNSFPNAPRLQKGGLVVLDPVTHLPRRIIALQYNPDSVARTLAPQAGGDGGDRSGPFRIKAPPVETIKIEIELDATDRLEHPDSNAHVVESGIHRDLAVLEALLYPPSERLIDNNRLASLGTLEIAPVEAPLTLFVWSRHRIVPVRVTELSVTEEAFDPALNPIRAKVSLGMRVLTVNDLGFDHRGSSIFLSYLQAKEQFAAAHVPGTLADVGIGRIP